jgi:hypothetical protein
MGDRDRNSGTIGPASTDGYIAGKNAEAEKAVS